MRSALLFCALAVSPVAAQDTRPSDDILSQNDMETLLIGKVVEFFDGSKSRYGADGRYGYTYTDDGPVWAGDYTLSDDSQVCVSFDNGSSRCDLFVRDGDRVVLIIADGTRFPVRNITVDEP